MDASLGQGATGSDEAAEATSPTTPTAPGPSFSGKPGPVPVGQFAATGSLPEIRSPMRVAKSNPRAVLAKAWKNFFNYHGEEMEELDLEIKLHVQSERAFFRSVPKTGVIYVMDRATELGFHYENKEWANLGQGAPECGEIPNQPVRHPKVDIERPVLNEYSPVNGEYALREAVANYYNKLFRENKPSKYTAKNVAITGGGRSGIARVMACLNTMNVGYVLPDYTAYEELLACWGRISPIPILNSDPTSPVSCADLRRGIRGHGLGAIVLSNPGNPTGMVTEGEELESWMHMARKESCMFIMDEFYSHYLYKARQPNGDPSLYSSAEYVEDVNKDPVLIINGLTKNWRCPGWRVCWVVGPENYIDVLQSAGSFLDGGANSPLQEAALPLLRIDFVKEDALALQAHFGLKRTFMLDSLKALGVLVRHPPAATFYIWGDVAPLPPPLNDGVTFFEEALKVQVICVPGIFFDINPNRRRQVDRTPFLSHIRFSFGPPMDVLERGIAALKNMVSEWKECPPLPWPESS